MAWSLTQVKVPCRLSDYKFCMQVVDLPKRSTKPVDLADNDLSAAIAGELPRLRRHALSLLYNTIGPTRKT